MTNLSEEIPLTDAAGKMLQRTEVAVAVEFRGKDRGDISSASSTIGGQRSDNV